MVNPLSEFIGENRFAWHRSHVLKPRTPVGKTLIPVKDLISAKT
jgi:hypothetical protein